MTNGDWGSAVLFQTRTSVRREVAWHRARQRPICDTLSEERDGCKADTTIREVRLPSNIDTFDPYNDYHVVLAWCLNLRGDLDDRERRYLVSAFISHGGMFFGGRPVQQVRDIFNLLWVYKAKWEEKLLRRDERLKTLDPKKMNQTQVRQLTNWVRLQLANMRAVA